MLKPTLTLLALLSAPLAQAQICVSVAEDRDALSPADRASLIMLAQSSFEALGEQVVPAPCAQQYTLANAKLGESVTATLTGPKGRRQGRVRSVEELGNLYDQLIRALVTGKEVSDSLTRTNVTTAQADPLREKADSLWVFRLGGSYVVGSDLNGAPVGLGFGYRYELDRWAITASADFAWTSGDGSDPGSSHTALNLGVLYFLDPTASASAYVGGGLGLGATTLGTGRVEQTGSGLEGHLAVGYSLFRSSTIRMLIEANLSLPFYTLDQVHSWSGWDEADTAEVEAGRYAPTLGLSLGVGF